MIYKFLSLFVFCLFLSSNVNAVALEIPIYGNWCGPGFPKAGETPEPVDIVDEACKQHDIKYTQCANGEEQLMCEANADLDIVESLRSDVGKLNRNQLIIADKIGKYFSYQGPFKALSEGTQQLFSDRFQVATELTESATEALNNTSFGMNDISDGFGYLKDVVVDTFNTVLSKDEQDSENN